MEEHPSLRSLIEASDALRHAVRGGAGHVRPTDPSEVLPLTDAEEHQALLKAIAAVLDTLAITCDYAAIRAREAGMSRPTDIYAENADQLRGHSLRIFTTDTVLAAQPQRWWRRPRGRR